VVLRAPTSEIQTIKPVRALINPAYLRITERGTYAPVIAEVLAAIAIATESTSVCAKAISALKRFTRDTKTADQDLHEILSCVQRSRNLLDILRAGLIKIKNSELADFDNVVSVQGFNQTIDEILDLAKTIAQGEAQISIVRRMTWSLRRSHSLDSWSGLKPTKTIWSKWLA
jgi:hypothetical protein